MQSRSTNFLLLIIICAVVVYWSMSSGFIKQPAGPGSIARTPELICVRNQSGRYDCRVIRTERNSRSVSMRSINLSSHPSALSSVSERCRKRYKKLLDGKLGRPDEFTCGR